MDGSLWTVTDVVWRCTEVDKCWTSKVGRPGTKVMATLQLTTLCCSGGYAVALQFTTLRLTMLCCSYGGAVACNVVTMVVLQFVMLWHYEEANVFFFFLPRVCLFSPQRLLSFLFSSQEHNREKEKDRKHAQGKFEGTKENDCVNHFNRRILDTFALDLDVAIGSGSTTTHGRIGFVETALVLFSNRFAQ